MKEKRLNEVKGVILVAAGLMVLASLVRFDRLDLSWYTAHPTIPPKNLLGIFGAYLGGIIIFLFGRIVSFLLPCFVIFFGFKIFRQEEPYMSVPRFIGFVVLLVSLSAFVAMFNPANEYHRFFYAGLFGAAASNVVTAYFSRLGGFIIFSTLALLSFALVTEILISQIFMHVADKTQTLLQPLFEQSKRRRPRNAPAEARERPRKQAPERENLKEKAEALISTVMRPKIQIKTKPAAASSSSASEPKARQQEQKIGDYRLPSLELLQAPPPIEERQIEEDLESCARVLEETLEDFGITAKVTDIERGPVITRYELEPAPGVKLNKIVALGDDVALAMKAQSVRIIAPIPGKGRVGVEVPNSHSTVVYIKEIFDSPEFQKPKSKLTLALGKDITGQPIVTGLDDMPHILIAGTTGSGKTVCVNGLILSLLYHMSPNDLKFLMVDPKMVELMPYNELPHLLCPVVTDAKKASTALNWVVAEMEERYRMLAKVSARNIEAYNDKGEHLPYIVVVIDEFADLMTVARDQIENAVTRLAQLSRAVGIHLILATQRPSVDVITGVIKANLPARVSFKVASKVDSRTVLDMNGADKLLGKGDMLFLRPGESKLIRIQGALVGDAEIERVVGFIKEQGKPVYDEEILKGQDKAAGVSGEKDELFDEAVRIVMECNQASVSILQRRMRLGYTRAARIIDMMEMDGLVGPYEGSKPRRILVDRQEWLDRSLAQSQEQKE